MKAKNSEGKTIRKYVNPFLPLMPVPKKARRKETETMMVCGYCKGTQPLGGGKAVMVNGVRVHPLHKDCIESAKRPLFNMEEKNFKA